MGINNEPENEQVKIIKKLMHIWYTYIDTLAGHDHIKRSIYKSG